MLKSCHFSDAKKIFLLLITVSLLFLPFINKAFNIDDPLFVWTAKHIIQSPLDPYGFRVNWTGTELNMSDITKNPPLPSYYMAFFGYLFGWNEITLHLAYLFPLLLLLIGVYLLAKQLCRRPFLAVILTVLTPVFFISATTLMCDIMMLMFWVWAIISWRRGIDKNSHLILTLSSLLIFLCAMTKYFGISLIFILFFYTLARTKKVKAWLIYLLSVSAIILWALEEISPTKGIVKDILYFTLSHQVILRFALYKLWLGIVFTGGCIVTFLLFYSMFCSRKELFINMVFLIFSAIFILSIKQISIYPAPVFLFKNNYGVAWSNVALFLIFALTGFAMLIAVFKELTTRFDSESVLLFLWAGGTFIFATFVNWSLNGRSILPLVPALSIILIRKMDRNVMGERRIAITYCVCIPALLISFLVARGDYILANSARQAAGIIHNKYGKGNSRVLFEGHWGFQYYMLQNGAEIIDMDNVKVSPGDIIVIPENSHFLFTLPLKTVMLPLETIEITMGEFITMNPYLGAGFYSGMYGVLPFAFTRGFPERYSILKVRPEEHISSITEKEIYTRAKYYMKAREYIKAASDYNQLLITRPYSTILLNERGLAFLMMGEFDNAMQDLNQAIRIQPKNGMQYLNRAFVYFNKKYYTQALSDARKASTLGVKVDPGLLQQLLNYGKKEAAVKK